METHSDPCQGCHWFPPSSILTPGGLHPFPSPATPLLLKFRGAPICVVTDPRGRHGLCEQGSEVPVPWHAGRVGSRVGVPLPTDLPNPPCPTSHGKGQSPEKVVDSSLLLALFRVLLSYSSVFSLFSALWSDLVHLLFSHVHYQSSLLRLMLQEGNDLSSLIHHCIPWA